MAQENPSNPTKYSEGRKWRSNTLSEYLANRNHEVIRWRSTFSHQKKVQLVENSVKIKHDTYYHQFIKSRPYKRHLSFLRFLNHYDLSRNFNKISRNLDKPDFVHLANVPIELAYSVAKFCYENKVPYFVDVRDLWPDIYIDFIPRRFSKLRKILLFLLRLYYDKKLYFIFSNALGITALTESFLQWALKKAKRNKGINDYIFPMSFERSLTINKSNNQINIYQQFNLKRNNIIITYVGNIGLQSNFNTILESAKLLESDNANIIFIFSGSGPELINLKKDYSHLKNVRFTDWLDGENLKKILEISSIGLIIYKNYMNYMLNIPNKFPEYLCFGNAIACGTKGEMSFLVKEYKLGFTFDGDKPKDFVKELKNFLKNPKNIKNASKSASKLHLERFLSSVNYEKYCDFIEYLLK